MPHGPGKQRDAGECCTACGREPGCAAWSWHVGDGQCFLKDNAKDTGGKPDDNITSGLHPGPTCVPNQHPSMCPGAAPCPNCQGTLCPCNFKPNAPPAPPPAPKPLVPACTAPHDKYRFCDTTLSISDRVSDLMSHIPDGVKPNLLTARGGPPGLQNLSSVGVPAYYWGTNCLHSVGVGCTPDGNCPTNFPSGPSMAATFDKALMVNVSNVWGRELRALYNIGVAKGLDCWGPVINLNRQSWFLRVAFSI